MIKGPWLMTPMYCGEKVAIRVSPADKLTLTRGPGFKGNVTDLDTGKIYGLHGRPCSLPRCYCDAEIIDVPGSSN